MKEGSKKDMKYDKGKKEMKKECMEYGTCKGKGMMKGKK